MRGSGTDEIETRELRYFVAVAEELHFGRAAQRLGIAQPPLSRAIRALEHRMGVTLFARTGRGTTLTEAGAVLLRDGRAALSAVSAAARRTRRAGATEPRLMLAMKANGDAGLLPEILRLYADQPAALAVEIMFGAGERAEMLRDGRADVGLLHWPQNDLTGLDFERLVTERLVVVLPTDHPLAGKDQVCLADLEGETLYRVGDSPVVYDGGQLLQMIALGRTVAVLPESVRGRLHSGLVTRPVPDAPPATVVVAWPQQSRSPAVAGFVRAAMEVAAMEVAATRPARSDPEPTA